MTMHDCAAPDCQEIVDHSKLMCSHCWFQVPLPLRTAVWRTWNHGKGAGTPAHMRAMISAIAAVTPASRPAGSGGQSQEEGK